MNPAQLPTRDDHIAPGDQVRFTTSTLGYSDADHLVHCTATSWVPKGSVGTVISTIDCKLLGRRRFHAYVIVASVSCCWVSLSKLQKVEQ
jgi:hypothetical protein